MRTLLVCRCTHAARPELKVRDFYVTGESYAGHYIPAVSHHVWSTNQRKAEVDRLNLKGLAIGNGGYIEPLIYACILGLSWHGVTRTCCCGLISRR